MSKDVVMATRKRIVVSYCGVNLTLFGCFLEDSIPHMFFFLHLFKCFFSLLFLLGVYLFGGEGGMSGEIIMVGCVWSNVSEIHLTFVR